MVETEPPGVEHEAARSGFLAFGVGVDGIADERVAQVQHVDADLVFPMHMWRDYSLIGAYKKKSKNLRFTERIVDITGENQEFDCIC